MLSKKESESPSIKSAFAKLSIAANVLNNESDRLSKIVSDLETSLKKLNIGLVRWVNIAPPATSPCGTERYHDELGYAKTAGKWGFALKTVTEYGDGSDADYEQWGFHDAPRQLRLKAVGCIPRLFQALAEEAERFTQNVAEKADIAQQLVTDLNREERVDGWASTLQQFEDLDMAANMSRIVGHADLAASAATEAADSLARSLGGADFSATSAADDVLAQHFGGADFNLASAAVEKMATEIASVCHVVPIVTGTPSISGPARQPKSTPRK